MQCLLYSPLAKQTIEIVARGAQSVVVLCEVRNLFTKMTANDAATYISPSQCFEAVMNTQECRASRLSLHDRQEDVHEFLGRLLEHFEAKVSDNDETLNLLKIFNISMQSTTVCQRCSYSFGRTETLQALALHFPGGCNEDAPDSPSRVVHINSLIDNFCGVEKLPEHFCLPCGFTGATEKKYYISKAPELLVLQLSRFDGGLVKIQTHVEFTMELSTACLRDENGEQITYRLTGMITHKGYSIAAGHYIAYVLIDGDWYEANDECVRLVSWPTVRSLQAYMLIYQSQ